MATFAFLLWRARNPLAFALLPPYFALEARRAQLWGVRLVIPGHASTYRIAMHEYYITLYPLSFLIAASIRRPLDAVVLAAHVTLFPRTLAGMARHIGRALRQRLSASRALVAER